MYVCVYVMLCFVVYSRPTNGIWVRVGADSVGGRYPPPVCVAWPGRVIACSAAARRQHINTTLDGAHSRYPAPDAPPKSMACLWPILNMPQTPTCRPGGVSTRGQAQLVLRVLCFLRLNHSFTEAGPGPCLPPFVGRKASGSAFRARAKRTSAARRSFFPGLPQ